MTLNKIRNLLKICEHQLEFIADGKLIRCVKCRTTIRCVKNPVPPRNRSYYLCDCGRAYVNAQDAAMCGENFVLINKDDKEIENDKQRESDNAE